MPFTTYLQNKVLDHTFKKNTFAVPANIYIGLSLRSPGEDGLSLQEPSGNGYARIVCNSWATSSGGATSNVGTLKFPQASGSWGTISHVCIFDSISGGNMIAFGSLAASKLVSSGDNVQFASGDIDITLH